MTAVCPTCDVDYRPRLTGYACPVCGTPAPGDRPRPRVWQDPDDRLLAIVVLATIANVLLLALFGILAL